MTIALNIKKLTKIYPNNTKALDELNLEIKAGDFFALLGSNGAGKTTIINIIAGLLNKSSGEIEVFNKKQSIDKNAIKMLIGLMPQEFNFNPFEPLEEILINQAGYYGIAKKQAKKQAEVLLKEMQLWHKRKDMAKSLSGGMKRRLMLARSLMHNPKILILDEPTAGVDVEIRRHLWKFLQQLNANGTTIILTTHYLEEAESLCNNIAIINHGKVILQSSMQELLAKADNVSINLELEKDIINSELTTEFKIINKRLISTTINKNQNISQIISKLQKYGIMVKNIKTLENRLENLFINLTKK